MWIDGSRPKASVFSCGGYIGGIGIFQHVTQWEVGEATAGHSGWMLETCRQQIERFRACL